MDKISSVDDIIYFKIAGNWAGRNLVTASRVFHKMLEIFQKIAQKTIESWSKVARKNINFLDLFMVSLQGTKICKFYKVNLSTKSCFDISELEDI